MRADRRDRGLVDRALSRQMEGEAAVVDGDGGDDVGVLLLAAATANDGHHGECLWKSASRALILKHVSRHFERSSKSLRRSLIVCVANFFRYRISCLCVLPSFYTSTDS